MARLPDSNLSRLLAAWRPGLPLPGAPVLGRAEPQGAGGTAGTLVHADDSTVP